MMQQPSNNKQSASSNNSVQADKHAIRLSWLNESAGIDDRNAYSVPFLRPRGEVTTEQIFDADESKLNRLTKFTANGLYSEQIFGPIQSFTCQCGKTVIPAEIEDLQPFNLDSYPACPVCGVRYAPASTRNYTHAEIKFDVSAVNPIIINYLFRISREFDRILVTLRPEGWDKIREYLEQLPEKADSSITASRLLALIKLYPHWLRVKSIPVIPPDRRPVVFTKDGMLSDKITQLYQELIRQKKAYKKAIEEGRLDVKLQNLGLTRTYYELFDHIKKSSEGKQGYIRQHLLGKRLDYSGTAVIVPHSREIDVAYVPYVILAKLCEPILLSKLNDPQLKKRIDDYLLYEDDPELEKLIDEISADLYVMLNRQPTLHRPSIETFRVIPTRDKTIAIPFLVEKGYNADHDGDKMSIYIPLTRETKEEFENKLISYKQLLFPGTLRFSGTSQIGFGIYRMTLVEPDENNVAREFESAQEFLRWFEHQFNRETPDFYDLTVRIRNHVNTAGRMLIEVLFGEPVNEPLNSKTFDEIVTRWYHKLIWKRGSIRNVKRDDFRRLDLIVKYAASIDISLALDDFAFIKENPEYRELKNRIMQLDPEKDIIKLRALQDEGQKLIEEKATAWIGHIDPILKSRVKGSPTNFRQLFIAVGEVKDIEGETVPYFIRSAFIDGLTPTELLIAAKGARKGSLDRSANTSKPGYATRKMVFTVDEIVLDRNTEDCGVDRGIIVDMDEHLVGAYLYRYARRLDDNGQPIDNEWKLITRDNLADWIGYKVEVRSPIYCKNRNGICLKCYGEYDRFLDSRYIGFIAAQSLGERATQLIMRVFHTGAGAEDPIDYVNKRLLKVNDREVYTLAELQVIKSNFSDERVEFVETDELASYLVKEPILIETDKGEIVIPKGCTVTMKIVDGMIIPAETLLFYLPPKTASLTSLIDHLIKLLDYPERYAETRENLLKQLLDMFWYTEGVLSIWMEIIVSGVARNPDNLRIPARLTDNPDNYRLVGIENIPSLRPFKGIMFQNFIYNITNLALAQYLLTPESLTPIERLAIGRVLDKYYGGRATGVID